MINSAIVTGLAGIVVGLVGAVLLTRNPAIAEENVQALPGEQCAEVRLGSTGMPHCTFKFADGVRCMSVWTSSKGLRSNSVSCVAAPR